MHKFSSGDCALFSFFQPQNHALQMVVNTYLLNRNNAIQEMESMKVFVNLGFTNFYINSDFFFFPNYESENILVER